MPPNKKINKGLSTVLNTFGYKQMAKDALKIKDKQEFHKYAVATKAITARDYGKNQVYLKNKNKWNSRIDLLEDLY